MKFPASRVVVLLAAMMGSPLQAQQGTPQEGRLLARGTCADCHATELDQPRSPVPRAPTFLELATTPGMTETALTVALTTSHAGMPMFRLTSQQRMDITAYILSLKTQGGSVPSR